MVKPGLQFVKSRWERALALALAPVDCEIHGEAMDGCGGLRGEVISTGMLSRCDEPCPVLDLNANTMAGTGQHDCPRPSIMTAREEKSIMVIAVTDGDFDGGAYMRCETGSLCSTSMAMSST